MAFRPTLYYLWADLAPAGDIGDADAFTPTNPSYPERVANQYVTGWYVSPDTVVKQPHQWMNSWLQGIDWRLMSFYNGDVGWDPRVQFAKGAVVRYGDVRYIAKVTSINKRPNENPTEWAESKFGMVSEASILLTYQQTDATLDQHIGNKNNPHGTVWSNFLGGVGASKSAIDTAVAAVDKLLSDHKARVDNPHGVTPAQVGTLPKATGGTFTGQVSMLRMRLNGGGVIQRRLDNFEIEFKGFTLGIIGSKAQKDDQDMVTEGNFHSIKMRNNWKFKAPTPALGLPLVSDLGFYSQSGGTIEYTSSTAISYADRANKAKTAPVNEPGFSVGGLVRAAGVTQAIRPSVSYDAPSGTVTAIVDGALVVKDLKPYKPNLLDYFPGSGVIKDIRVFIPALTPYQRNYLGA